LIDRWESYLIESMVRKERNYGDDELEERWKDNLEGEAYFHGPPQAFDEEVIRCWESVLRKYTSSGGGSEEEEDSNENEADSGDEDDRDEE
jgi:FKBP-type peptidyl-prolyl cis-trans isomerase (trigger factor)